MKKEKSPFFHDVIKGCEIVEQKILIGYVREYRWSKIESPQYLIRQRCKTHDKQCCKCGWDIGNHYGTSTQWLNRNHRLLTDKKELLTKTK